MICNSGTNKKHADEKVMKWREVDKGRQKKVREQVCPKSEKMMRDMS